MSTVPLASVTGSRMQSDPTERPFASVQSLRHHIIDDVCTGLGWAPDSRLRWLFMPLIWPGARQFAKVCSSFDRQVAEEGIAAAMRRVLTRFAQRVEVDGAEQIPAEGPLLVLANHPGTFDGVAISAVLGRNNLKILVWAWPLLCHLTATSDHMIFATSDPYQRMAVLHSVTNRLRGGDALLIFPTSDLDPDPDVQPGSAEALQRWSPSIGLILRRAPETRVLITIVSGVLAPKFLRHPLARLPKNVKRQRTVAEMLQMLQQLVVPRSLKLTPRVSFSKPLTLEELADGGGATGINRRVIAEAEAVLARHVSNRPGLEQRLAVGVPL
jgi:1-acyl-sn-glycerol-3-phosphate acyltransferase